MHVRQVLRSERVDLRHGFLSRRFPLGASHPPAHESADAVADLYDVLEVLGNPTLFDACRQAGKPGTEARDRRGVFFCGLVWRKWRVGVRTV